MVEEPKRTIAYLCPGPAARACGGKRRFFLWLRRPALSPCPCGKSALKTEIIGTAKLTVPCLFCGEGAHRFPVPRTLFSMRKHWFSCAASTDCCYVGEEGPVFAAMKRLEEAG